MKVFISWSGERSQALAQAVASELEASNFGLICVTPENVSELWVLFEAGALAKSMKGARVVPLLFNLDFSDINGGSYPRGPR